MANILSDTDLETIGSMVSSFRENKEMELEVGFKYISYSSYIRIVKSLIERVGEGDIETTESLDVIITLENGDSYRTSFNGELAGKFLTNASKQRATVEDLIRYVVGLNTGIAGVQQIYKNKNKALMLTPENVNAIFKLSAETPISGTVPKPTLSGKEKIMFRMKIRNSFKLNDNVRIDLTEVQQAYVHWKLNMVPTRYEVEMEVTNRKIKSDKFIEEFNSVLPIIQDSEVPVGKSEVRKVLDTYKELLSISYLKTLEKRTMISMQISHLIQHIPNRYAFTDKADGERHNLITLPDGSVYLIDINLSVKKLKMKVSDKKHVNMIVDGELIDNEHGKMFLIFDVLISDGVDYRTNHKHILTERIAVINNIVDSCFKNLIPFGDYAKTNTDMELTKIRKFYLGELAKYYKEFNKRLGKSKEIFITRKLYFVPYGIDPAELFMYADMVWRFSVYENLVPYTLDGGIYTQIDAPYMVRASQHEYDTIPLEYKWKDPKQNSIDFYIMFEKDKGGSDIVFYDESAKKGSKRSYKIARLFVGNHDGESERPTPFVVDGTEQKAFIYAPEGIAQDSEEKPIDDMTVVEFVYDMTGIEDGVMNHSDFAYRWIPIRTRYDKTEAVKQRQTGYGNNKDVSYRIWNSIVNPITDSVIGILANPSSYPKEMERLRALVAYTLKPVVKKEFVYYQKRTLEGGHMRAYHNWIKNNMIQAYCQNKRAILDIGCGRGGDIQKFINAHVGSYVGTDIDNHGLYEIDDCAACRYDSIKKKNPKTPPMTFINADSRGIFDVRSQERIIKTMSDQNKSLIKTFLSGNKKYNVINCQFSLHYYLSDETSWNNFCKNVDNHLAENGYFLITTFDGKTLVEKLKGKQKMAITYTDNSGTKNTFAEIVKLFSDKDMDDIKSNPFGHGIDLYNSTITDPGVYVKEYLVDPDFLAQSLKEKCGLDLIESDTFFNLFHLYKGYFSAKNSDSTNKQLKMIHSFYRLLNPSCKDDYSTGEIELAKASFAFSSLNRYYIFKRKTGPATLERVVGMNGKIELGKFVTPYLEQKKMVIDIDNKHTRINPLYSKMKTMFGGKAPSVYVIRHTILRVDDVDDNIVEVVKVKEGSGESDHMILYKSPEKHFYPVYQQFKERKQYVFSDKNVVGDLNTLSYLSK